METSSHLRRMLGATLAATVFFTQTGVAVAASQIIEGAAARGAGKETETKALHITNVNGMGSKLLTLGSDDKGRTDGLEKEVAEMPATPSATKPATPAESATPVESVTPVVSPKPTEGTTPVTSPVPAESATPVVTPAPTESATPVTSPVPAESATPVTSPVPTESATPVATPIPTESAIPVVTPAPETESPEMIPPEALLMAANARAGAIFRMHYYHLGYGVDLDIDWKQAEDEGITPNATLALGGKINGKFAVETSEDQEVYGYRAYTGIPREITLDGTSQIGQTFCIFPSQEQLGRVPDQEFEGWYLYPSGTKKLSEDAARSGWIRKWQYGDESTVTGWMHPIKPKSYGVDDPMYSEPLENGPISGYNEYGELGDTWDGKTYYDAAFDASIGHADGYNYIYATTDGRADVSNPVSMVGRWVASSNSEAAGSNIKDETGRPTKIAAMSTTLNGVATDIDLYGEPIAGEEIDSHDPVDFTADRREYYARVPADVESVNLTFNSHEIYFDYHADPTGKSPVQVTSRFAGEETVHTLPEKRGTSFTSRMLPEATYEAPYYTPQNSLDDPAHAEWTVKGIPVHTASGKSTYTDIQVEVTAPNGTDKTTYTFHVQRMGEPTMTQKPGNTPFGMIERDSDDLWGGTENAAARKQAAKEYFTTNRSFDFSEGGYPRGDNNNGGVLYRGKYSTAAWVGADVDVDKDPTAIVVYQNSVFLDPGISVVDTEGKTVDLTGGAVTRTLQLRQVPTLSGGEVGSDKGTPCWYQNNSLSAEKVNETLQKADGSDAIDLRGLNVLPGIYTLEYSYTDPVSGRVYDSTGNGFATDEGRKGKDNFSRTLVVLPMLGDVDMDGAVTSADAMTLGRELKSDSANQTTFNNKVVATDPIAALFVYRVCDVDKDGQVSVGGDDISALEALPDPQLNRIATGGALAQSDYFYIPLPTPDETEDYIRFDLNEEGESVGGAKLSMVYLGKEGGSRQSAGYTVGITGPWGGSDTKTGIELEDTFWLGVKLTNSQAAPMLNKSVETFTFSLVYDSTYVKPAVVLDAANWGSDTDTTQVRWEKMMRIQNLTGDGSKTVWRGVSGASYDFTEAAGYDKLYDPHYSSALLPLEKSVESGQGSRDNPLKKLTFSVSHRSGSSVALQSVGDQWLFAVPFTLKWHPRGQAEMQMVEMGAGMTDLTLVGSAATGYPVLAYSVQEKIVGGKTENLREQLHYTAAGAKVPLGVDRTPVYYVYNEKNMGSSSTANGVYSMEFEARYGHQDGHTVQIFGNLEDGSVLPPGISFDGTKLSGWPGKAGTYDFVINNITFRMVVDKAPLRIYANDQSSYYGETEFRGEPNERAPGARNFTFRYATEDILKLDRERAEATGGTIAVDGDGAGLAALLGERSVQPTFKAVLGSASAIADNGAQPYDLLTQMINRSRAGDEPVRYDTVCGQYAIVCNLLPILTNYTLEYVEGGSLEIMRRPFRVQRLADSGPDGVTGRERALFNDGGTSVGDLMASLGTGAEEFSVVMPELDTNGNYRGRPLTGGIGGYTDNVLLPADSLQITYTAEYQRLERDMDESSVGTFTLESGNVEEFRDVEMLDLRLIGGTRYSNYELVTNDGRPVESIVPGKVQGLVRRRNVQLVGIPQLPPMEYQYGDQLTRSNELQFYILKDGDQKEGIYNYTEMTEKELGIRVTWATPEEVEADQEGSIGYKSGQIFTWKEHGARLCLAIDSADEHGNTTTVKKYSDKTLVVTRRTIVLTADRTQRFYGEENGELSFRYDPNQLAACDRAGLTLRGAGEELKEVLSDSPEKVAARGWEQNYVPPTLTAVQSPTDATELTSETPYTGTTNAVRIEGASCDNYMFRYQYTDQTGMTTVRDDYGASAFTILPRLIVVDAVVKATDLAFAYADTKEITTAGLKLTISDVELGLPEHDDTVTRYYPNGGSRDDRPLEIYTSYAPGAPAVLDKDKENLHFTYTATFVSNDGENYVNYVDFSKGHFNMEDAGSKEYPVQVSRLALAGEAARNYNLVFRGNATAGEGLPGNTTATGGIEPGRRADKLYYVPKAGENQSGMGTGTIALRPIENIEIIYTGKREYTYGDTYTPNMAGPESGDEGMRITIEYTRERDNYLGNPYIGEVRFRVSGYDDMGNAITTFDDRRLEIYWLGPEDTQEVVGDPNHLIRFQENLSVDPHDGARLVVAGKRGDQVDYAMSEPTNVTLRIVPRSLTLTAGEVRRCYGEANPPQYNFTFNGDQLARQDREALGITGGTQDGALLSTLAANRGYEYTPPVGATSVVPGSPVLDGGKGGYPIMLSGGNLTNYELNYEPGLLRVYPRPIRISSFESNYEKKPIYTIFASTTNRIFDTNVTTESSEDAPSVVMTHPDNQQYPFEDGVLSVSGPSVYGDDVLGLRIRVEFYNLHSLEGASGVAQTVRVTNAWLMDGTTEGNYILVEDRQGHAAILGDAAIGAVKLRSINTIELKAEPRRMEYTYGETLDLRGLQVLMSYDVIEGETQQDSVLVSYVGPDQFAQYGLYVNYYDSGVIPPESAWKDVISNYRPAEQGDHLTIAPLHDSTWTNFVANGKYLIVSAQRHEDQQPSEPQIVSRPVTVSPLTVEFTLSAEDKTYDGTTQAAGTLTLTNPYPGDLVYPVTGATMEGNWGTLAGLDNFEAYTTERGGYTFSTGVYVPAEEEPWGTNHPLDWTEGYNYSESNKLTFSFLDPNVAYQKEPTHDSYGALSTVPVQVTGIRLGGPDAENYRIAVSEVTQNNVTTVQGYQGSALPQATIHKANRAKLNAGLLPRVEVDPNTNVVRVVYDQPLSALESESAAYQQETHYEYALQYDVPDEAGQVLRQWAGTEGESLWGDERYFGGETVSVTVPEGYVPREEDIPKGDSLSENETRKGQVYAWGEEDTGFTLDASAYPGSPGEPWANYDLYKTDRTALPRDAVFWPLVRAAETHNYRASPILTSHGSYTPEMLQAVTGAWEAMLQAPTEAEQAEAREQMKEAAEAVESFVKEVTEAAQNAAEAEKALLSGIGDSGNWPAEWPGNGSQSAVKTYLQRLEVVSVEEKQSAGGTGSGEQYQVPTLEAVWFTDLLTYPKKEHMDAVLRNHEPIRYQGYAWDKDRSAELKFDDGPISLAEAFDVEITRKENGQEVKETVRLNEDHTVQIYAYFPSHSGGGMPLIPAESIKIDNGDIQVVMGADPVKLTVTYTPADVTNRVVRWSSSDESVATVDRNGKLTFVGIGVAVITATTLDGVSDSITVTVVADWKEIYPNSIFDLGMLKAFFDLQEDMMFYPEKELTRGEAALLLARFYIPNESWTRTGPAAFPDLTGKEEYAQAARLLGSLGVFLGLEDGRFGGEELISRAEFIVLLVRMMGIEVPNTAGEPHAFLDTGEEDTWAYAEIDAMNHQPGVLRGVGEGYFAPGRKISRAETVSFLSRLLREPVYPEKERLKVPLDVDEEHWARNAIIRAVNDTIPTK